MTYAEHYFENLLFDSEDAVNSYYLTENEKEIIEICVNYVLYSIFKNRDEIKISINKDYFPFRLGNELSECKLVIYFQMWTLFMHLMWTSDHLKLSLFHYHDIGC